VWQQQRWMRHEVLATLAGGNCKYANKEHGMRGQNTAFGHWSSTLAVVFGVTLFCPQAAQACEINAAENAPERQVIACGEAVVIERERAAQLEITKRPNADAPRVIDVQGGAILINISPGQAPTQVRTPHAIATVRGTTYIVDAGDEVTSVFVLEGAVTVRRTIDASTVTLTAGEGADVSLNAPVITQDWEPARAEALLARFGR